MKKYQNFYLKIFIFLVVKFSVYLNRVVFVMFISRAYHGFTTRRLRYEQPKDSFNSDIEISLLI